MKANLEKSKKMQIFSKMTTNGSRRVEATELRKRIFRKKQIKKIISPSLYITGGFRSKNTKNIN